MKDRAIAALNWYLEEPLSSYSMLLVKILLLPLAVVVVAAGLMVACVAAVVMLCVIMPLAILRDTLEEGRGEEV